MYFYAVREKIPSEQYRRQLIHRSQNRDWIEELEKHSNAFLIIEQAAQNLGRQENSEVQERKRKLSSPANEASRNFQGL